MVYGEGNATSGSPLIWISTTGNSTTPNGAFQFEQRNNGATQDMVIQNSKNVSDGVWHFFAAVRLATASWKLYIDGASVNSSVTSVNATNTTNGKIGVIQRNTTTQYFDGMIDDVRLYKYDISDQTQKTIYNEGAAFRLGPNSGPP
jgi:hypothetical protein